MVPVIALLLLACNPAGSAFKEADQLAADGKYDEAIVRYEQVFDGWPDSPEAKMSGDAIIRALHGKARTEFEAQDWDAVYATMNELIKRDAHEYPAFVATSEGEPLETTRMWRMMQRGGASDDLLDFVLKKLPNAEGPLRDAIAKDTCGRLTEFPAWKACDALPKPDLGPNVHAPPDVGSIGDGTALAKAIDGCEKVAPLKAMCPDAGDAFALLPDMAAMKQQQEKVAEAEAGPIIEELNDLAQACETAKKRRQAVEDKWAPLIMAGSIRASGQFMVEERPYNDKVSENGGKVGDIQRAIKDKGWPEATTKTVTDAATAADSACSW